MAGSDGSSWLAQVLSGDWEGQLNQDDAAAIASRLIVAAEHIRITRELAQGSTDRAGELPAGHRDAGTPLLGASEMRLPMNRKERYYTGSVLPGIVASNGLVHLPRFLRLCGLDVELPVSGYQPLAGVHDVQVFTEYSFAESLRHDDLGRFPDAPMAGDTPDVVLCGPDWLLAVEAKMYLRPTKADLDAQMNRQQHLLRYLTVQLALDADRVRHVLLLPQELKDERPGLTWDVVTWQELLRCFDVAGDGYWLGVLCAALADYDRLRSKEKIFGANADGHMTGLEVTQGKAAEEGFASVGRGGGGRYGKPFLSDLATGHWKSHSYEVRTGPPPNPNWMTLDEFLAAIASS